MSTNEIFDGRQTAGNIGNEFTQIGVGFDFSSSPRGVGPLLT